MSRIPPDHEMQLVAAFFGNIQGYFVEVGANDPYERSPTWHLEQAGWTGVLVEPQPDLAARLRESRKAKVFAVACSSRGNAGRMLPLHVAGPLSSLDRRRMAPGAIPEAVINVPIWTLDDVLEEAGSQTAFDFLSINAWKAMRSKFYAVLIFPAGGRGWSCSRTRRRPLQAPVHDRGRLSHIRRYENNGWCLPRVRHSLPMVRSLGDIA